MTEDDKDEIIKTAVVDAVHKGSEDALELADALIQEWWNNGNCQAEECGTLVSWDQVPEFDVHAGDGDFFAHTASEARLREIEAGAELTAEENVAWTRHRLASILDDNPDDDIYETYELYRLKDAKRRTAWVLALWSGYSVTGVKWRVVGVYRTLDEARARLKRLGVIDAGDYKGPEQLEEALAERAALWLADWPRAQGGNDGSSGAVH